MVEQPKARCMKCKEQVFMTQAEIVLTKTGLKRWAGVCGKCGTKLSRIIGK